VWVVGLGVLALALAAPESLTTSVALGGPFVPFGELTSTLATPIGAVGLVLCLAALGVGLVRARAILRRADLLGALLIGLALGCIRSSGRSGSCCCRSRSSQRWPICSTTGARPIRSSRGDSCVAVPSGRCS
jgi:hypothetical protein